MSRSLYIVCSALLFVSLCGCSEKNTNELPEVEPRSEAVLDENVPEDLNRLEEYLERENYAGFPRMNDSTRIEQNNTSDGTGGKRH